MARISEPKGNLLNRKGAYTKPLSRKTTTNLAFPGQFANRLAGATTGNLVAPGQFVQPVVRLTGAQPIQRSVKTQTAPRPVLRVRGSAGRSTQADGVLGGQFGNLPKNLAERASNFLTERNINPSQLADRAAELLNRNKLQPNTLINRVLGRQPQAERVSAYPPIDPEKYREQINQLTSPYTGAVVRLTGANMEEPVNTGFPGTDPRQPYSISKQYLSGGEQVLTQQEPLIGAAPVAYADTGGYYSSGGGYSGYGGGSQPNGYSYGSGQGAAYQDSLYRNVMSWRVATG